MRRRFGIMLASEDISKVVIPSITALIALYNWRSYRFRGKLKDDLDILQRYRREFTATEERVIRNDIDLVAYLEDKIQRKMLRAYVLRRADISELLTGVGFLLIAIFLPYAKWAWMEGWELTIRGVAAV